MTNERGGVGGGGEGDGEMGSSECEAVAAVSAKRSGNVSSGKFPYSRPAVRAGGGGEVRAEGEMLAGAYIPSEPLARVFLPAQMGAHGGEPVPGADDRITCQTCTHLRGRECSAWRELQAVRGYAPDADLPRRCDAYRPVSGEEDQRSGRERWPTLDRVIDEPRRAKR